MTKIPMPKPSTLKAVPAATPKLNKVQQAARDALTPALGKFLCTIAAGNFAPGQKPAMVQKLIDAKLVKARVGTSMVYVTALGKKIAEYLQATGED